MDFLLPWGLASVISLVVHLPIRVLELAIISLEIVAIYFGKYPKILKSGVNPWLSGLIFFLAVNLLSSIVIFLWTFSDLGV